MSTEQTLANIDKVELRNVWANEAADFTPWLADNISELGTALGMELELREQEADVGGYSLDILASDLNRDRPVVIENQLETTDHDHLGKLLTYAAGFDANVVVWLTRQFRDEHRQALDWLNQRTGEDTQFFGVVVELWKIGESLPAPHFNLVAAPNDWRKESISRAAERKTPDPSSKGERYRAFFQRLIDSLREDYKFTAAKRGQDQNWYSFSSGYGRLFKYSASFTRQNQARIEVYIDSGDAGENRSIFDSLKVHRGSIESDLGYALDWQPLEGKQACRIAADRDGTIDNSDDVLEDIRNWMAKTLLEFRNVFDSYFEQLTAS